MSLSAKIIEQFKGKLIVSCQASAGEPLCDPSHIKALALSALNGGAAGLRLEGADNISSIRQAVNVPIIGLVKSNTVQEKDRFNQIYITTSFAEAESIAQAGADIVAVDATNRKRSLSINNFINQIHNDLKKLVWADISTLEEGIAASQAGADIISTTMHGYTKETYTPHETSPPALDLLKTLCQKVSTPIVLEGRVWHPEEVEKAFSLGAYAVVVGSAITRPQLITKRFVKACPANN